MPYISQESRHELDEEGYAPQSPGELNYRLTGVIREYFKLNGESYRMFNDVVGALEACKLELYRRIIAPYEDQKMKENGDVY